MVTIMQGTIVRSEDYSVAGLAVACDGRDINLLTCRSDKSGDRSIPAHDAVGIETLRREWDMFNVHTGAFGHWIGEATHLRYRCVEGHIHTKRLPQDYKDFTKGVYILGHRSGNTLSLMRDIIHGDHENVLIIEGKDWIDLSGRPTSGFSRSYSGGDYTVWMDVNEDDIAITRLLGRTAHYCEFQNDPQ